MSDKPLYFISGFSDHCFVSIAMFRMEYFRTALLHTANYWNKQVKIIVIRNNEHYK